MDNCTKVHVLCKARNNVLFEYSILLFIIGKSFPNFLLQNVEFIKNRRESLEQILSTHPYPKKWRIKELSKETCLGEQIRDLLKTGRTQLIQRKCDVTQPTGESNLLYT